MKERFNEITLPKYEDGDVYYGQVVEEMVDDDTIVPSTAFTSYEQNKFGIEDGFSGDISKSSFTQTEKDVVVG